MYVAVPPYRNTIALRRRLAWPRRACATAPTAWPDSGDMVVVMVVVVMVVVVVVVVVVAAAVGDR